MATLEKYFETEAVDKIKQARFLSEEESKNDPENEPFRSKYKAREIYNEINDKVMDKISTENEDKRALLELSLCLTLQIGILHMDTEELAEGEEKLMSSLKCIDDNNMHDAVSLLMSSLKCIDDNNMHDAVSLLMNILNNLGILWTGRNDADKGLNFLEQAEKLYLSYQQNVGNVPHSHTEQLEAYVGKEEDIASQRKIAFESMYTHTLYYLAQVHAQKGNNHLSGRYCHMTLHRQLQTDDFNSVDWSMNAVTLSQYYLSADKFTEARNCLASGSLIYTNSLKNETELLEDEIEIQNQRSADIDRCWVKYGLALLETSRDSMLNEVTESNEQGASSNDSVDNENILNSDNNTEPSETDSNEKKCFEPFNLELTVFEEQITDKKVRIFAEARKIFLFVVNKINNALKHYNLDSHASDAVEIIQDNSKAYKLLAFFELDMSRQCKMHKRRIDMLSELLAELNPKHYLLVNRQLMYEVAEAYSSMVDLKITAIELEKAQVTVHNTHKINKLIHHSIERYQEYIDSLKGDKPDLPDEFPEGDVRPALVAFFCIARLYSKILEPEIGRRLALMSKSLDCYKFVIHYCEKNVSAETLMKSELDICREMVNLMPLKMERLKNQGRI